MFVASAIIRHFSLYSMIFQSHYEGEPGTGGDSGNNPPNPTGGTSNPPQKKFDPNDPDLKKYIQQELNRVNAQTNQKNRELVQQLEALKQKEGMTEQEKNDLQARIDELTATFQTKEEQTRLEIENVKKDLGTKLKNTETERDTWRNRFEQKTLSVEIYEAANKYKAFNPQQIAAILLPITKVQEGVGQDGKPNGEFHGSVDFTGRDKDGKAIKLKLTIDEAIKAMTEMPEQYGNLFRTEANSGLGGNTNGGSVNGGRLPDIEGMSPQDYAKHRQQILQRAK